MYESHINHREVASTTVRTQAASTIVCTKYASTIAYTKAAFNRSKMRPKDVPPLSIDPFLITITAAKCATKAR